VIRTINKQEQATNPYQGRNQLGPNAHSRPTACYQLLNPSSLTWNILVCAMISKAAEKERKYWRHLPIPSDCHPRHSPKGEVAMPCTGRILISFVAFKSWACDLSLPRPAHKTCRPRQGSTRLLEIRNADASLISFFDVLIII